MAFLTITGVLTILNVAAAVAPHQPYKPPCPKPALPEIVPTIIQSVAPAPITIGPQAPGVIEHISAPYEINYFAKPWIVKHQQGAALNVFTQTPVVVDEFAPPAFNEAPAPPAVVVEEVCPEVPAPAPAPAPVAPAPAYPAPAPPRPPSPHH